MRRVLLLSACSLLLALPAAADPISLSYVANHGEQGGASAQVCSGSATAGPISSSCNATFAVDGLSFRQGNMRLEYTLDASIAGDLTLRNTTSLDVWRINGSTSGTTRYTASAETTAAVTDTVAIMNAGSVTNGFLRLVFGVTGGLTEFVDFNTLDGYAATTAGSWFFANGSASLRANGVSASFTGPTTVSLDVPLLFGVDQALSLSLLARADANVLISEGYRILADFGNTAVLTDAVILDANKQSVAGATLQSANGISYGDLATPTPPTAVPEPSTLLLVAGGLASLIRPRLR